ncbi:TBCD protein [Moesziomyces antarcticus]|uniref:Related to Tubulin-folding cofactor D n=1 Tax=Pseudozyma antarctica TaxID=84753 RepID=A0A5C3FEK9_PSEA2|nr:TBCD protein [Moesziomyces antarcticus]GAK62322.1 TBCD protein [Moesziomyces antarcticus]SPO42864.1 related to Tubulin-folding cofactor D [Moesziomyces antarcticus]
MIDSAPPLVEEKELVRFERAQEYLSLLSQLVPSHATTSTLDPTSSRDRTKTQTQDELLGALTAILDEYQDQAHLLDPYLHSIVSPPVEALQRHVRALSGSSAADSSDLPPAESIARLSKLVYAYTKVRGYKTIVHYFPHEVADLTPTLAFLEHLRDHADDDSAEAASSCWQVRYVCLLWLSLICMIPFDLAKFDCARQTADLSTASRIASVARHFLASPGKERDAAAVVLGKLFQRTDVQRGSHFAAFLDTSAKALASETSNSFEATGILQALCQVVKTAEPAFVAEHFTPIQAIAESYAAPASALERNGLVAKFRTKLTGRLAVKLLRPRARRGANKLHMLGPETESASGNAEEDDDESDVPEEIESFISVLIEALQHNDTVVRFSAAKGLARVCDRLPTSFLDQVVEAIVSLFQINIPDPDAGTLDLSAVSEHTWQGTCMALAELARRGLLFAGTLAEALPWMLRALLFDVRRGAHSVGANVRDAVCYVVWALARSNDTQSIRPHAMDLACRLVVVATLDRDVSIRRAASAAFQECVGRLELFPHGIDVIRMTDFYAVSVRRTAFLECAVGVAQFTEYRPFVVDHLVDVVTVHWDAAMRRLGAQALARIAVAHPESLLELTQRLAPRITTGDTAVLHGTLLSLAETSALSRTLTGGVGEAMRARAFGLLDLVRPSAFRALGAASLVQAACQLIGAAHGPTLTTSPNETQTWEKVLNLALARPEESVHTAAADAIANLGSTVDLTAKIHSTIEAWSHLSVAQQQSNALLLGAVDYTAQAPFDAAVAHLIAIGRAGTKDAPNALYAVNIETRRNAADSLARAVLGLGDSFARVCTAATLRSVVQAMLAGLTDYTMDQRGDVGSWVRLSCIVGLRDVLVRFQTLQLDVDEWLGDAFHSVVAALWKQAAERIDHVRYTAGTSVLAIYGAYSSSNGLRPHGYDVVQSTYGDLDDEVEERKFREAKAAFPLIVHLLRVQAYRAPILEGLVVSVGSKTDLGERIIGPALCQLTTGSAYARSELLGDLFLLAKRCFGDNRVFVPALHTVNLVLEGGEPQPVAEQVVRLVRMATSGVQRIKSILRLTASARLAVNLLLTQPEKQPGAREMLLESVPLFLAHAFPTVRTATAEHLYAILSSTLDLDTDAIADTWTQLESALLDTDWTVPPSTTTIDAVTKPLHELLA